MLLLGGSGIGKSEAALELVRRGYLFVADDVVLIKADEDGQPCGSSPELVRHYMELRGIGIIHIPSLFGEEAVLTSARIRLAVNLQKWGSGEVDRIGLEQRKQDVAGFEIPALNLPVAPGRNLATLIEVGVRNYKLQQDGSSSARDLDERIREQLRRGRQ